MPTTLIPTVVDRAFRRTLIEIAPTTAVRRKVQQALDSGPAIGGRDQAVQFFGADFDAVVARAVPLVDWLDRELATQRLLPHFSEWLNATGFGNDYRMIDAFDAWSQVPAPQAEMVH